MPAEIRWGRPLACAGRPRPAFSADSVDCHREEADQGSAADVGVRPTIYADARKSGKLCGIGLEAALGRRNRTPHQIATHCTFRRLSAARQPTQLLAVVACSARPWTS